jgi:GNAT acetyltransferase
VGDLGLMRLRADTDFTYDARGRMVLTNEPLEGARRPAPRLFFGRTMAGDVVRVGAEVPDALARRLEAILAREPADAGLRPSPATLAAVREALAEHGPVTADGGGPAYRFPESTGSSARPGGAGRPDGRLAVRLTEANRALVRETYPWLDEEWADWQPCFAVVRDGAAVSVCFSSRLGPGAAEAGVETLPAHRGRGYAAAVTAAWGAAVRAAGRVPLYSTGWENLASQGVARRAGLILFGADVTWA